MLLMHLKNLHYYLIKMAYLSQMQMTKKQFGKEDKILAWHGYQSFAENEVDADTVHKIGVKLAQELWPEYQVIVATHLNTKCFHNHFVLNSVSFLDGKKFHQFL